jgi:osmotically inducible protein OsmC
MNKLDKVLYTAHATSTGGRDGISKTDDGKLNLKLSVPKAMGGDDGAGTNPEQLFACGYSACFLGAMKAMAGKEKVSLPETTTVSADVSFGPITKGFCIAVKLVVKVPGMANAEAQKIVNLAHEICPYSNATRGNIEVNITLA